MTIHYELSAQERTQIDYRWHGERAPLCGTGDGHYRGVNPADWSKPRDGVGKVAKVDCPRCCSLKGRVAPRERNLIEWKD